MALSCKPFQTYFISIHYSQSKIIQQNPLSKEFNRIRKEIKPTQRSQIHYHKSLSQIKDCIKKQSHITDVLKKMLCVWKTILFIK